MYSVVLMMAMTTGGDMPACHRRHSRDGGCNGGYASACYGGGYGGGCSGGYGGGCYGGGCYGGGCYGGGYYPTMPRGEPLKMPGDKKEEKKKEEIKKPIGMTAPAKIIVSLPADATLTIDDYTSPARSDTHIIVSSPLGTDETRTYVLTARAMRDGKMQTTEERVTVRGGEETKVTLNLPTAVAAR